MAMTIKAAAPLDAEAALPMALLMQHLKDPEDEALVIAAARLGALSWLERRVGISLSRRTWRATFTDFASTVKRLRLPMGATSVTSVTYLDAYNAAHTWPAASWRFEAGELCTMSGLSWPAAFADISVTVEYEAGYLSLGADEPALQTAALMLAGHFYRHREENAATVLASMPFGVEMLISDIRMPVLA